MPSSTDGHLPAQERRDLIGEDRTVGGLVDHLPSDTTCRVCTRCVMDNRSDPLIRFDGEGICNHCHEYRDLAARRYFPNEAGAAKLAEVAQQMRAAGRGRDYDCLLGVSGGVDSTFLAWKLKELELRPLAVHFDNGWNSELAVMNIERMVRTLDIDLETYVVDWDDFKDLQVAYLKADVINAEVPTDHGFMAALYRTADREKIRYVVGGQNIATEGISVPGWGYNYRDLRSLRAIHRRFGKRRKLATYPTFGPLQEMYYWYVKRLTFVNLLNYMPYVKSEAMELIQEKLGWQYYGGKHHESIFTRFFQSYILPRKFGIDKRRGHLSNLIYSGQLTREQALQELAEEILPEKLVQEDKSYVLKKLGLGEAEFETIMSSPPRSHRDYPNLEWFFRLRRALGKTLRG